MNRVASCTITFGQKGLGLLRHNPEAVAILVYFKAQGEVMPDGYVQLHLPSCPLPGHPRQRVWETAKALDAFVVEVEVGPDSGGLGGGGVFLEGRWRAYEVMPFFFQRLAEVYDLWKAQHPPFENPEAGLEAIEAVLEAHKEGFLAPV